MDKPKRKNTRLPMFCYEESRAYFITICTHKRQRLFGDIVTDKNQLEELTEKYPSDYTVGADSISARIIAEIYYEMINNTEGYKSYGFVVMPDHIHMIVGIIRAEMDSAPTGIPRFVQAFKRNTTIKYIRAVKEGLTSPFAGHLW